MAVEFSLIFSAAVVDFIGLTSASAVLLLLIYKTIRWRKTARSVFDYVFFVLYESRRLGFVKNLRVLLSVIFNDASTQRSSFGRLRDNLVHLCAFWGFVGLTATTTLSFIFNPQTESLELSHPIRILGNVSGVAIVVGLTAALLRRIISRSVRTQTTEYDLSFLTFIYAASVSGFVLEYASMIDSVALTSAFYYFHLATIGMLILTAPFSKFLHAIKLPLLILFYRYRCALLEQGILVPMMPLGLVNQKLLTMC